MDGAGRSGTKPRSAIFSLNLLAPSGAKVRFRKNSQDFKVFPFLNVSTNSS